ncbi:hypothetical protein SJAV_08670 [Sulfurisphaera javensis]|uniref:UBZ4-type domain-containing protein n=1 Tax=Sulfurisphaera javensis TaxID=2049879 RepID=A0AAT9GQ07_9CREN
MRCPLHKNEEKEYNRKKDLVIHISKTKIDSCPICGAKIKSGNYGDLLKHLEKCYDDSHKELLRTLATIFGNHGKFKRRVSLNKKSYNSSYL